MPQILDAAERLFAERGPVHVSIRDIAAEAGLPHSAIYRYFASKDEIVRRVLLRGRARQIEHEQEVREGRYITEHAFQWTIESDRAYALTLARLALQGETMSSLGIDASRSVAQRTLDALETGLPLEPRSDHDPRTVMAALMALALGYVTDEAWILDAVGLQGCDPGAVRRAIDQLTLSIAALSGGSRESCQ